MRDIIPRKQQTLHTAWATPALRPSGRGGIFSGLVQNMTLICRTRWSNRPHVERGQRRTKPPMSEPPHYKQKQEENGIQCQTNKRRERRGETKTIFSFPPKKISRNEMERAILGGGRSFQFNGRTLRGSAYRLHRRTCYTKKEPPRRISEVLKVAATRSVLPLIGRSGLRLRGHASLLYSALRSSMFLQR